MEYTIQKLSQMAGISTRTLRYYDEIGLLKPARINSSGYRIYGAGVDRMQALKEHREQLLGKEPNWICFWKMWRRPLRRVRENCYE